MYRVELKRSSWRHNTEPSPEAGSKTTQEDHDERTSLDRTRRAQENHPLGDQTYAGELLGRGQVAAARPALTVWAEQRSATALAGPARGSTWMSGLSGPNDRIRKHSPLSSPSPLHASPQEARDLCIDPLTFTYHGCRQFRAFEKSTGYGDVRTRNCATVAGHRPVSLFCAGN